MGSNIGLVVIYFGLDVGILDELARHVDSTKTLLYLVHWRRNDFDQNIPDYTAKPEFGSFVEAAHQHGFRVMPHVNLVGVSTYHPLLRRISEISISRPVDRRAYRLEVGRNRESSATCMDKSC